MHLKLSDYILLEDDYLLVVNKTAGLMVEPDRNQNPSLLHEVKKYLQTKTGQANPYAQHIHRLDRAVSGIVLFTKKREVLKNLSEQFAERRVKKVYKALTTTAPSLLHGRLEHWHRKEKKKAVLYTTEIEFAEKASLDYSASTLANNKFLWDIELHTGKYHQIRAQLASIGCPILGDKLYGSQEEYKPNAIALQAWRLIFAHPIDSREVDLKLESNLSV